ncbi:hypothetical protein B0J17DRAFT_679548 [Rhizoctonia solani]|nr:hypothetical protein B0J17DRAFT_679548 [Rhizoctonia solani]
MPGGDPLWYCHACNAEMRPIVMTPEPLCASCQSPVVEQLSSSDAPSSDDPRAFNAMSRLFEEAAMGRGERGGERSGDRNIGLAIDPIGQLLGAVLGMRNLGPETPPRESPRSTSPELGAGSGSGRPSINIRRESGSSEGGRSRSGFQFSFRSNSGSGGGGLLGGFGRREARQERQEPIGIDELLASLMANGQGPNQGGDNRGRPPPMLQHMLMGLLGAGVAQPGVGAGSGGDGRWGDYVLNQEALDQIITQLMDSNHAVPVPVPEDMIATWPRTILTPDNPLEDQDCAVCKDSFKYEPPEPNSSQSNEFPEPQEAVTLPCKHSFHVECIEPWVKVKGTCPVCRHELVPQGGQRGQGNNAPSGGGGGNPGASSGSGSGRRDSGGNNNNENAGPPMPGTYYYDLD